MESMEIPNFDYFIDREKNRPCLVAGNAPSLKNFPFRKFKGIYFLMNLGPQILKGLATPNYWVSANHYFPIPHLHLKAINDFKDCIFIFADTAIYCFPKHRYDYEFLKKNLKVRWFAFDDRHFGHNKCDPPRECCKFINFCPQRITFYEFIQQHFNLPERCPRGNTGVLLSLAFAILMGCSPIYLQGIELPIYYKDYRHFNMLCPNKASMRGVYWVLRAYFREWIQGKPQYSPFFTDGFEQTLVAFEYMVNLCHKFGIEIYNLSPTSALNRIKILPYLDYRKVCG